MRQLGFLVLIITKKSLFFGAGFELIFGYNIDNGTNKYGNFCWGGKKGFQMILSRTCSVYKNCASDILGYKLLLSWNWKMCYYKVDDISGTSS